MNNYQSFTILIFVICQIVTLFLLCNNYISCKIGKGLMLIRHDAGFWFCHRHVFKVCLLDIYYSCFWTACVKLLFKKGMYIMFIEELEKCN